VRAAALAVLLASWVSLSSCDETRPTAGRDGSGEPSPKASIVPAPLATGHEIVKLDPDAGRLHVDAAVHDGGAPPPRALREDRPLPPDTPLRETSGLVLEARFRWPEHAALPKPPESDAEGLARAREKVELGMDLELSGLGRMRGVLASTAFPLPEGTEFRAGSEYYGHVLVSAGRRAYTVLSPGMLRAVLVERRTDVVPLVAPKLEKLGGGSVLGHATERAVLVTATGKLELEQAQIAVAGSGGMLLCRFLLELIAVEPDTATCALEMVPLLATYAWPGGGKLVFEATRVSRRQELEPSALQLPPQDAEFRPNELVGAPPGLLLSERELAEFRSRPAARPDKLPAGAPKEGLFAVNRSDTPRYVLVDEIPVAWLRPGAEQLVLGLPAGKYLISARDFLGGESLPGKVFELPVRYAIGDDPAPK
jgi:hypothetical protein